MASYTFKHESDAYATASALRIAAERYDRDATVAERAATGPLPSLHPEAALRLARQFRDQSETARRIADDIEETV